MRHGNDLYLAVQGEKTGVKYVVPGREPFDWPNCIVGSERGGIDQTQAGDLIKVLRRQVTGPLEPLTAQGVTGLDRQADVLVGTTVYSIDLGLSTWGEQLVRLELVRRPIVRHQDLEDRTGR